MRLIPVQQGITTCIDVKSVDEYSARIEQLEGTVYTSKRPVTDMGYFAVC
jgi:predicted enzyme related to lactoylglutathione lyase